MTSDDLAQAAVDLAVANNDLATLDRIAAILDAEDAPRPIRITPLAKMLIGRIADPRNCPRYGSHEWDALPGQDPRRAAAIMKAAEAWRDHRSPFRITQDLADEMAAQQQIAGRLLVEASHDVAGAADWETIFARPTHAELAKRRGGDAA